jgi:hypothetical protein
MVLQVCFRDSIHDGNGVGAHMEFLRHIITFVASRGNEACSCEAGNEWYGGQAFGMTSPQQDGMQHES